MVLKTFFPGCGVRASLMLFLSLLGFSVFVFENLFLVKCGHLKHGNRMLKPGHTVAMFSGEYARS